MSMAQDIQDAIGQVRDQESFIQRLLIDTLHWEIDPDTLDLEETAYEYTADELNSPLLDEKCNGRALQITFESQVPWGVFVLEFHNEDPFTKARGLAMPLRQLLNALVPKRRRDSSLPAWGRENLLFLCTYKYKHFRFAYFQAPKGKEKTAPLKMFGWNKGDTAVRTLCEHNLRHLEWDNGHNWAAAFDIEKVTKDFYNAYDVVFHRMESAIGTSNDLTEEYLRQYTQTLFNRLMFLRFIEKKGWLKWNGQADNYLARLFQAERSAGESFFRRRLIPLFFQGLAQEHQRSSQQFGEVPFLNGGLFERSRMDERVTDIPDQAFGPILSLPTDSDPGGLFYRYNFTIEESTPLDIEVAVDPEMLGRVFEKLVTGRHESGSYYTPRPIVSFMCRESLKVYLVENTSASADAIETLVDHREVAHGALNTRQADEIILALQCLKACDPACGSGAYLLGLMQEIIAIRRTLQNPAITQDTESLHDIKLGIISNNLYGVDIDPFATNIAMLRLWLSLAIEADNPRPLPNLEFKIETGNSLLGACCGLIGSSSGLFGDSGTVKRATELKTLIARHVSTSDPEEKASLYEEIRARKWDLRETISSAEQIDIYGETINAEVATYIVWPAEFPEVFVPRPKVRTRMIGGVSCQDTDLSDPNNFGFDIVLANPPYVRMELFKEIKPQLRALYPDVHSDRSDLYCYFYGRAVEMLAPGGTLAFISPNKFFRADYGRTLRQYLGEKTTVLSVTDFGDSPIFEATAYPMVFVAQKNRKDQEGRLIPFDKPTLFTDTRVSGPDGLDVAAIVKADGKVLPEGSLAGKDWSFAAVDKARRIAIMKAAGPTLKEYVNGEICRGVVTGCNQAFIINGRTRDELISQDPKSEEVIKPLLMGRDIKRWTYTHQDRWLIYTPHGIDIAKYPAIKKHLLPYKEALEGRATEQAWYELQQPQQRYVPFFEKPKIVYQEICTYQSFAYDVMHYVNNKLFLIPGGSTFLLGILNSAPAWEYLSNACALLRGGALAMQAVYLETLPIPRASSQDRKRIEKLVQKCLDAGGTSCEAWETEINQIAVSLYGLGE